MLAPAHLLSASRQNLGRLVIIRMLVLMAQVGTLAFVYVTEMLPLDWPPILVLLALAFNGCIFTLLRLRKDWPVTELEFAVQLGFDLLIHSGLLYYLGGSTNPFVAYYLVPLTIAAATLSWVYSLSLTGFALTGYTVLLIWYQPLHFTSSAQDALLIKLHLFGMWLNFALSAAFITFFVVKMSGAVRLQDQLQALRREESMRDEQLLAVATQAAGAAHELGTPLSTMSVLLSELTNEYRQNPDLLEDLALLRDQVSLCKSTLQQLVRASEADRQLAAVEQPITVWMQAAVDRWHLMRPEVTFQYSYGGKGDTPMIMPPADLTQSVLNLLNNAADACADDLRIALNWDVQWISVRIHDQGAGVPLAIAEQLGKPFFTTKGKGFGLGLFLSQASVTRAGGTVKLYNDEGGGTLTELRLPRQNAVLS
ncbi:ATP-binding protein [Pseudomonas sp. F1_0610]|uniref:ATP-binding protein n=1 Tax=Pseudomonas sp. F1_0610 TaxID=3114284 RepID=UPI0039C3C29C